MVDFSIENNLTLPWDEKDFELWIQTLVEEGYDKELAECAVNGALEKHLNEDGTVDNYEELGDDIWYLIEVYQDEQNNTTYRAGSE